MFDFSPNFFLIRKGAVGSISDNGYFWFVGMTGVYVDTDEVTQFQVSGNTLSWYASFAFRQLNDGNRYYWIAIGQFLSFDFSPKFAAVTNGAYFLPFVRSSVDAYVLWAGIHNRVVWGEKTIEWVNDSNASFQMNNGVYYFVAIG